SSAAPSPAAARRRRASSGPAAGNGVGTAALATNTLPPPRAHRVRTRVRLILPAAGPELTPRPVFLMIHPLRWDPAAHAARRLDPAELPAAHADLTGEDVVWIDLEDPTPEEEDRVFRRFFPVHPLTLEDVTKPRREPDQGAHLPKVEEFRDYLFVVVNPLPSELAKPPEKPDEAVKLPRLGKYPRPQLSAVLTRRALITH